MLSDNSEKSRNPLKKAMRRRNAKTVQFAAPTYVEASDYDYSTEDEEQGIIDGNHGNGTAHVEDTQQNAEPEPRESTDSRESEDEEGRLATPTKRASFDREQAATQQALSGDDSQTSPKLVDKTEAAPLKSRKGTPRNADSFLKDDGIETKKITITPGLLREDNMSVKSASSESQRGNSLETLVKTPSPTEVREPPKKETKEKKKEKQKGGMLSGLFKKKDKKDKKAAAKEDTGNESDMEKPSNEYQRESPKASPLQSGTSSPVEKASAAVQAAQQGKQQAVKGAKPQRPQASPQNSSPMREKPAEEAENRAFVAELPGDEVAYEMAGDEGKAEQLQQQEVQAPGPEKEGGLLSPLMNALTPTPNDAKPKKAKRSKNRVELDDFDSPTEEEGPNPFKEQEERRRAGSRDDDRLSESPVDVGHGTFMHGTEIVHIPTPGEGMDSDDSDDGEPESLTSSPSIIEHPGEPAEESGNERTAGEDDEATPTGPGSPQPEGATAKHTPTRGLSSDSTDSSARSPAASVWSDSSLRAWYDDGSDIRDMLMMIHDKSNATPVPPDHPMMAGLFAEERKGVEKLMGDLDGLLGSYLQRKGISLG